MRDTTRELMYRLCASPDESRPAPRTVLVAAHPDDETASAGARLPRLRDTITLVHVTDGSPRDLTDARSHGFTTRLEYAHARRKERERVLALAGISERQVRELRFVDQEAALSIVAISRRLADLFLDLRPEVVLTHPYEGGHPDHDATAFAVHSACAMLERAGLRRPLIAEMTSYHNGWNGIQVFQFLPAEGCDVTTCVLAEEERALKQRMMDCYRTQRATLAYFPVELERFRPAPAYDFTRRPHEWQLFYENFPWGMTGERFCSLARDAMEELGMSEHLATPREPVGAASA